MSHGRSWLVGEVAFGRFGGYSKRSARDRVSVRGLSRERHRSAAADAFRRYERKDARAGLDTGGGASDRSHAYTRESRGRLHVLQVRQSGLDVDNMSATSNVRTTRMHRMARRAV